MEATAPALLILALGTEIMELWLVLVSTFPITRQPGLMQGCDIKLLRFAIFWGLCVLAFPK